MALSLCLLGQPEISGAGGPIRLRSKKGQALLWYLAAQPDDAFPRVHLASLLWEEAEESDARHSLSMTLQRLRAELPAWPIAVQEGEVGWDAVMPKSDVWLDTMRFEECLAATEDQAAAAGSAWEQMDRLRAAVALWRGPFLDGFRVAEGAAYEEWLLGERRHWESRVIEALWRLVDLDAAAGAWGELAEHARMGLKVNPLHERFHRSLMLALYECGDRVAAAQQYEECERVLRKELHLAPEPATIALRDAILAGEPVGNGMGGATGGGTHGRVRIGRRDGTVSVEAAPSGAARDGIARPMRSVVVPGAGQGSVEKGAVEEVPPALPLIGRQGEWDRLVATLSRAERGAGRAVVLHGEAGIGKTRLVEEILWRSRRGPAPAHDGTAGNRVGSACGRQGVPSYGTVLIGHGYEATRELPYAPIVEALNRAVPALDIRSLGLSDVWLAELGRLLPDIPGAGLPRTSGPTATYERHRLFESMARLLAAVPRPAFLILEDLHAADAATMQLFAYLVRSPVLRGVSFLATVRAGDLPESSEPLLRALEREGLVAWEEIGPLSLDAVRALQTAVTGGESVALAERLYDWSHGNPLFAVELLRTLGASGNDVGADGEPDVAGTDAWERLPVPETVQAVVYSRLGRLSPEAARLLDAAAIIEGAVPLAALRKVADLAPDDALRGLDELVRAGMLRETGEVGTSGIAFEHDLVRIAIRARLTRSKQEALHRRAFYCLAETAEGLFQGDAAVTGEALAGAEVAGAALTDVLAGSAPGAMLAEGPGEAARDNEGPGPSWLVVDRVIHHALAGARWEEGLTWSLAAAGAAERFSFMSTCARFLEQALRCLEHLPVTKARQQQAVDILLRLSYVGPHFRPKGVPGWLEAAANHAERLGDGGRIARVAAAQAMIDFFQGHMMKGLGRLGNALSLARSSGDTELLLDVLMSRATLVATQGDFERAIPLLEEAAGEAVALEHPRYVAGSRVSLALVHGFQGDFDRAESMFEELIEDCRARRDASGMSYAFAFRAITLGGRGDWAAALTDSREAIRWAEELSYPFQIYIARLPLGPALLHEGDPISARAAQQRTLDLARESATRVRIGRAHAWMGAIEHAAGRITAAEQAAQIGLDIAREQGAQYDAALCIKVLGEVAASAGCDAEARERLVAALETFHALGARPEAARCHAALADVNEAEERDQHRKRADELFQEMGMTGELARPNAV